MNTRRIQDQTRNNSRTSSIIGLTGYSLLALGVIGLLSTTRRVLAATKMEEHHH